VIIGTAGHIDHGKTSLVLALTGVDTDRLPEEKRRGITIDLGFAPLDLDGVGRVGVVDVPGHEAFVHTMVAGAAGVDLALIVIAADEGVMPQTREHLAVLELLGVTNAVVALTKSDLVDETWLALVSADVRHALETTAFSDAPIVPVSVKARAGIDTLRVALADACQSIVLRSADEAVRLPIDRVFTRPGAGTVVTGTLWSGTLRNGDDVLVRPGDRRARVRGIQSHGAPLGAAQPATRVAVALAGVHHSEIRRGDVLVRSVDWPTTLTVRADVALLPGATRISPRGRVRFHLGTREVGARIVVAAPSLEPGETRTARIVLDGPVVARGGDRFVIRRPAPFGTVGGGVITDAEPAVRRPKPFARPGADIAERVRVMLEEEGREGVTTSRMAMRLGTTHEELAAHLATRDDVVAIGESVYFAPTIARCAGDVRAWLRAYHDGHEREAVAPLEGARAACLAPVDVADHVMRGLVRDNAIVIEGAGVRLADWTIKADDTATLRRKAIAAALDAAGAAVPSVGELERTHGAPIMPSLRMLEKEGKVVALSFDRFASSAAVRELWMRVKATVSPEQRYRPSELKTVFGVSRQYLMVWLEYFDRLGYTRREGDVRAFNVDRG
jgi:selenocysteine-specific elongation factor